MPLLGTPGRMMRRFLAWDALSKVAALLCFGGGAAAFVRNPEALIGADWVAWVLLPQFVALVGAPQIGMLVLIRLTGSVGMRRLFLAASLAMLGLYAWFAATVDLTGSSTAGVALVVYPIGLGVFALAIGCALLLVRGLVAVD